MSAVTSQPSSATGDQPQVYHFNNCKKIFIQRDYSEGTGVRFQVKVSSKIIHANYFYILRQDSKKRKIYGYLLIVSKFSQTRFPAELEGRISEEQFLFTVNMMNKMYAEAEKANCSTFCEGCMACLSAYVIYFCSETHYEKCLRKVARFVVDQVCNEHTGFPLGLDVSSLPTTYLHTNEFLKKI